jgi:hypothetical protein
MRRMNAEHRRIRAGARPCTPHSSDQAEGLDAEERRIKALPWLNAEYMQSGGTGVPAGFPPPPHPGICLGCRMRSA